MNAISRALSSVVEVGREILSNRLPAARAEVAGTDLLTELCRELLEHRGEATGLALAGEVARLYRELAVEEREPVMR